MNRTIIRILILAVFFAASFLPLANAADDKAASGAATRPTVAVTISCDKKDIKAGDEIPITFVIKNVGETPCAYMKYETIARMDEYRLSAIGPDNKPVVDPLAERDMIVQGPASGGTLAPGESFTKVVSLNLWALVVKPGKYHVSGVFYPSDFKNPRNESNPSTAPGIEIEVGPRTDQEMAAYIDGLSRQFSSSNAKNDETIQKLVFTGDRRIVPILINAMYDHPQGNMGFWANKAIRYYLPKLDDLAAQLLKAANQRGLTGGMTGLMQFAGCTRDQIKDSVRVSLSADHPDAWAAGALEAQTNCDDSFTPRLIALATMPGANASNGGVQAIYALAMNRTDESVAALKKLLDDPKTKGIATQAIQIAYSSRGVTDGRKMRPDDFGPEYQTLSPPK